MALTDGPEALRWRIALIDQAQHSIDVQYYSWEADASGMLVLEHLIDAAARGVRVRILLDDWSVPFSRRKQAALATRGDLHVRVFNPLSSAPARTFPRIAQVTANARLRRRMHNKMLVADGRFAIVGGRNIGDKYFGLDEKSEFIDLDLLVAGPVVGELVAAFGTYWNSRTVVDPRDLVRLRHPERAWSRLRHLMRKRLAEADLRPFVPSPVHTARMLTNLIFRMHPGRAKVLFDNPNVGTRFPTQLADALRPYLLDARQEVHIISSYLAPAPTIMAELARLAARNVDIHVVTNSLGTTDVTATHTVYKAYRRPLLDRGADLYELRPDARWSVGTARSRHLKLHVKLLIKDREHVLVGSMNLDPRSMYLNTELALDIHSPGLAEELTAFAERFEAPDVSWKVLPWGRRGVLWQSGERRTYVQPARHFGQRIADWVLGFVPLEDHI